MSSMGGKAVSTVMLNMWAETALTPDSPRQVWYTIVTMGEFQDLLEQTLCNEKCQGKVTLIWPNMYISDSYRDQWNHIYALHGAASPYTTDLKQNDWKGEEIICHDICQDQHLRVFHSLWQKILIQNVKTFSSGKNAQTVWLVVYKYSD